MIIIDKRNIHTQLINLVVSNEILITGNDLKSKADFNFIFIKLDQKKKKK